LVRNGSVAADGNVIFNFDAVVPALVTRDHCRQRHHLDLDEVVACDTITVTSTVTESFLRLCTVIAVAEIDSEIAGQGASANSHAVVAVAEVNVDVIDASEAGTAGDGRYPWYL
jgi:hypothetical protein